MAKSRLGVSGGVALLLLSFTPTAGNALTFFFSFTDTTVGHITGTVTGEIDGLVDNSTSAATAVIIDSAPSAYGLSTPFSLPLPTVPNSFVVSNGIITNQNFSQNFLDNPTLELTFTNNSTRAILQKLDDTFGHQTAGNISYTSATPLPPAWLLLGSVLSLFGFAGFWRNRIKLR
jgi:hypothetical protein